MIKYRYNFLGGIVTKAHKYLIFILILVFMFNSCGNDNLHISENPISEVLEDDEIAEAGAILNTASEEISQNISEEKTSSESSESEEESTAETSEDDNFSEEVIPELDSSGFVILTDVIPNIILEVRYYSTYNFVGERIDGYEEPIVLLTKEAADALKKVNEEVMEQGFILKIYDGYRPQMAVDHFIRWSKDENDVRMKEYFYPEIEKSNIFPWGYVAEKSGHSRGSTIDLTLFDLKTGKEADMGGTFDYFGKLSYPTYKNLTDEQLENREILRNAMMNNGFKPAKNEWWHFTLENEPYPNTYFTFPVNSNIFDK